MWLLISVYKCVWCVVMFCSLIFHNSVLCAFTLAEYFGEVVKPLDFCCKHRFQLLHGSMCCFLGHDI